MLTFAFIRTLHLLKLPFVRRRTVPFFIRYIFLVQPFSSGMDLFISSQEQAQTEIRQLALSYERNPLRSEEKNLGIFCHLYYATQLKVFISHSQLEVILLRLYP